MSSTVYEQQFSLTNAKRPKYVDANSVLWSKDFQITPALCNSLSEYLIEYHQVDCLIVRLLKLAESGRLLAFEATSANAVTATSTVIRWISDQ
jgi:hypothetical protein